MGILCWFYGDNPLIADTCWYLDMGLLLGEAEAMGNYTCDKSIRVTRTGGQKGKQKTIITISCFKVG